MAFDYSRRSRRLNDQNMVYVILEWSLISIEDATLKK
jgi:hypothetical protein